MDTVVRVVVADADDHTRNLVHLAFASQAWSVREAVDAAGAVRVIAAEVPEVLVIDVDLPTAGGVATARALRAQAQTASVGVLMLVGPTNVPDAASLAEVDAHVLARPFDAFDLLAGVEGVLAARSVRADPRP